MSELLDVRVASVRQLTPLVREFTFEAVSGELPGFSAGSHVQVHMPGTGRPLCNAYSLLSDPQQRQHYRIAVRLQEQSRGGSRFMHEQVKEGDVLRLSPPANLFAPHSRAGHHLMIAGGIGITPFMAYIAALEQRGGSMELHYAYRSGLTDTYLEELAAHLGAALHPYDGRAGQRLDIRQVLSDQPLGTHVYICGPDSLISDVCQTADALGWPAERIHWEAFAAPEPGEPFVAELADGRTLAVPGDYSLLEALEQAGVPVPNLCRGGVCGQCMTPYSAGEVEHRDLYLSDSERADHLMPCVSRGKGGCTVKLAL